MSRQSKKPQPWLKARLKELGKKPAWLARALGVAPPRIFEIINGKRGMQPEEIRPIAIFLEWRADDVLDRLFPENRPPPRSKEDDQILRMALRLATRVDLLGELIRREM